MTKDENATAAPARAGGGMKKGLLITVGVVVLLAGGGFAGSLLGGGSGDAPEAEPAKPSASAVSHDEPALYASLHPPLVVNFRDSQGATHYMQVTLEVMARDPAVIDAVKLHSAAIRNSLILLFSDGVDYSAINTREHKERMLADALTEVRKVLRKQAGTDAVEAVYFTSLIVQ